MNVITSTAYRRSLKHCDDATLGIVGAAMNLTAAVFGQPHLHSGRGIRRLRKGMYECRAGLSLRLVFKCKGDTLIFAFAGTHDEVQAWIKNRR